MIYRALEISYEVGTLPCNLRGDVIDFRNMALAHLDAALTEARAGEWEGTEQEGDKITFSFHVDDFDRAEAVLKRALAGTPYAGVTSLYRVETTHAALVPELAEAFVNRGNTFVYQKQFELARGDYTRAIELETRDLHAA